MKSTLMKPLRFLVLAFTDESTPRRIAMGFAIGAAIGLIPKDNLTVLALIVLLFAVRVNILAGIVGALLFTFAGHAMTPFLDHMGASLLSVIPLQGFYERMAESPFGAWTRLNNTVVAGGLLVGLLQLVPLYWIAQAFVARRNDELINARARSVSAGVTGNGRIG